MKVVWSEAALRHLEAIHDYISGDSLTYAKRMVDRLTVKSKRAASFPEFGQMVPEYQRPDVREIIEGPYRIVYRIEIDRVVIVAVIHGASALPPNLS